MILERHTSSLCNTCYKDVPASIRVDASGAWMTKFCSQHGEQRGLVERDPLFYQHIVALGSPMIYNGYFVDVTRKCNLRCQYCYYPLKKEDPDGEFSIDAIVNDCILNAHRAPFVLTGGEPTTRPDLPELIKAVSRVGPVELLSNGVRLADPDSFEQIIPLIMNDSGVANLNLSIHRDETEKWKGVLELARRGKIMIESALIVIDSKETFFAAIDLAKEYADVVQGFRIKAASRIWDEQKPNDASKIFCSDMIKWLEEEGRRYHIITRNRFNKTVFINVAVDDLFLMFCSWHETGNVDLRDIDCAPYYRARNGEVLNIVAAMLVNEGIGKGWVRGRRVGEDMLFDAKEKAA